jgi:hypothetical protein
MREWGADLGGGSAPLILGESVPDLLSSPAVLHPVKRIFMHASKMLCQASGVVGALSWNRGVWAPIYPRSCIRTSQNTSSMHFGEEGQKEGPGYGSPSPPSVIVDYFLANRWVGAPHRSAVPDRTLCEVLRACHLSVLDQKTKHVRVALIPIARCASCRYPALPS